MGTTLAETARTYYEYVDEHAYESLRALLTSDFRHVRPDRTLRGRQRFVRFMREERPMTDTAHAVDAVYRGDRGVAVRGRLLRGEEVLFEFVDAFSFEDGRVAEVRTYTR